MFGCKVLTLSNYCEQLITIYDKLNMKEEHCKELESYLIQYRQFDCDYELLLSLLYLSGESCTTHIIIIYVCVRTVLSSSAGSRGSGYSDTVREPAAFHPASRHRLSAAVAALAAGLLLTSCWLSSPLVRLALLRRTRYSMSCSLSRQMSA